VKINTMIFFPTLRFAPSFCGKSARPGRKSDFSRNHMIEENNQWFFRGLVQ
jgi:hypothetical protein